MNSQAICKCGHNFASHQLFTMAHCEFTDDVNKEHTHCRHSEHSIPDCACKGFVEKQFTSLAEKKRWNRQQDLRNK